MLDVLSPKFADIGEEQGEVEFEPFPEEVPVETPAPKEPVPA